MDFRQVYEHYKTDMKAIDDLLHREVVSRNEVMNDSAIQLLEAGGKRIRPLFALLCSEWGDELADKQRIHALSAAVELIHMATLVHDDVIDDASVRRGRPTVRAQLGNRPAMYTGDFLFARAIRLITSLHAMPVHEEMSNAIVRMCEGEIDQIRDFYELEQPLKKYLRRIYRKTALLISVSCALGATVAGAEESTISLLRQFGHHTGMAFQLVDDILDYSGDAEVVGKPIGNDLIQGNITLPALYAANIPEYHRRLAHLVQPGMTNEQAAEAVQWVRASGGIEYTMNLAHRYLDKAQTILAQLPDHPSKESLAVVARFVIERLF